LFSEPVLETTNSEVKLKFTEATRHLLRQNQKREDRSAGLQGPMDIRGI